MMGLLRLAKLQERARETILAAFPDAEEGCDRDWMIDLLEALATEGDPQAWDALRDIAASGDTRAQDNLATTDEAGLQWVVDHVLPSLGEDEGWRIGMWLPNEEADDATPLQRRLRALDERRMASLRAESKTRSKRRGSAPNFLRDLRKGTVSQVDALDFARRATPSQWRAAARLFLRETRQVPLRALKRAFVFRPFPLPVHRLFRQASHPDRGWVVMELLGTFDTPAVRRFTRGLLQRRPLPWNVLDAIEACFHSGDEPLLFEALRSTEAEDDATRHSAILDTVALFHRYPEARWQHHAEWILEHSPCSMCRGSAVDWLIEHGTLPETFAEEAPYDAEPDIRDAVAKLGQNTA